MSELTPEAKAVLDAVASDRGVGSGKFCMIPETVATAYRESLKPKPRYTATGEPGCIFDAKTGSMYADSIAEVMNRVDRYEKALREIAGPVQYFEKYPGEILHRFAKIANAALGNP